MGDIETPITAETIKRFESSLETARPLLDPQLYADAERELKRVKALRRWMGLDV